MSLKGKELLGREVWTYKHGRIIHGDVFSVEETEIVIAADNGSYVRCWRTNALYTPDAVRQALAAEVQRLGRLLAEFDHTFAEQRVA